MDTLTRLIRADLVFQVDYSIKTNDKYTALLFCRFNTSIADLVANDLSDKWERNVLTIGIGLKL